MCERQQSNQATPSCNVSHISRRPALLFLPCMRKHQNTHADKGKQRLLLQPCCALLKQWHGALPNSSREYVKCHHGKHTKVQKPACWYEPAPAPPLYITEEQTMQTAATHRPKADNGIPGTYSARAWQMQSRCCMNCTSIIPMYRHLALSESLNPIVTSPCFVLCNLMYEVHSISMPYIHSSSQDSSTVHADTH